MRVIKVINNNIVSAYDADGIEILVVGKGVGFKAVQGKEIDQNLVEKVFKMSTQQETDRFKELLVTLPQEHLEVADKIITYAKDKLARRLNESVYITLTDHINFAISRFEQNIHFETPILSEIRRYYTVEYAIGEYALQIIKENLSIDMPEAEAASIALHIINAEYDSSMGDSFHITRLVERITDLIHLQTGITVHGNDYFSERLLSHIKYIAGCLVKEIPFPDTKDFLYTLMQQQFPQDLALAIKIASAIEQETGGIVTQPEIASLAVHLKRIKQ